MPFTERTEIEKGFTAVYDDRIAPELDQLESERQALLNKAKQHAGIPMGIAAFLALIALWKADELTGKLVGAAVLLALGGVLAYLLWQRQARKWGGSVADTVMPVLCDFLGGLSYDRTARLRFPVDRLQGLGMIGNHNRANMEDRIEGTYRDTEFEMVEANLVYRDTDSDGDSRNKTVFKGLLFRIGVPEQVPSDILIARDHGGVGNKLAGMFAGSTGRGMPQVEFDHEEFEKAFAVHADDPDAARRLMPAPFLDNLLAIAKDESDRGTGGMTAAFQGESFYLALWRNGDFLKMGSLTTPVGEIEEDLHRVFDDLALVRRIIDRLHGDAPTT
jgi:hypothetical protein